MQAVVALKSPHAAKSRLASVLNPEQRRELFYALAQTVIDALNGTAAIDAVLVVTASAEVAAFARRLGCDALLQSHDAGTAPAFEAVVEHLRPLELPGLLMIAGDLPLLTPGALQELIAAADAPHAVVLAPDRRRSGTNALLCSPPDVIRPRFGEDSFSRHVAAARQHGLPHRVIELEALAFDVDVPSDLDRLARVRPKLLGPALHRALESSPPIPA
ncbi:MAG: 2-phospho-L-lactate guanylyltransferase [Steroidobacteraceae bacterium]